MKQFTLFLGLAILLIGCAPPQSTEVALVPPERPIEVATAEPTVATSDEQTAQEDVALPAVEPTSLPTAVVIDVVSPTREEAETVAQADDQLAEEPSPMAENDNVDDVEPTSAEESPTDLPPTERPTEKPRPPATPVPPTQDAANPPPPLNTPDWNATKTAEAPDATATPWPTNTPDWNATKTAEAPADDSQQPTTGSVPPAGTVNLGEITPSPPAPQQTVAPPPGVPNPVPSEYQWFVDKIIDDAVNQFGLDRSTIRTLRFTPVTWPDSSLGCPMDGNMYMMVLTDGFQIVLEADGQRYFYHTQATDYFVYCPTGEFVDPSVSPDA